MTPGQRFARLVTNVVVRVPFLWRVFRAPLTRNFDRLAPEWDATRVSRERLAPMVAALESLPDAPDRALDVGTGTGAVARLMAELWPDAEVIGVDASAGMIAEAASPAAGSAMRSQMRPDCRSRMRASTL